LTLLLADVRRILHDLFPSGTAPRPFLVIEPVIAVRDGRMSVREAAKAGRTTAARITALVASDDLVGDALGPIPELTDLAEAKVRSTLGQLLIGQMAEHVFEDLWFGALGDGDLRLRDDRAGRTDTDFLVEDASNRQVFRLNIKFHGSTFRKAAEMVGLDPLDTFALGTYKIHGALEKQDAEHLPYIFVVIGVRGLTGASVGALIPDELVAFQALVNGSKRIQGKRSIEEAIVTRVLDHPDEYGLRAEIAGIMSELGQAEWRVISARRADHLLRSLLFERAYALRVRAFAQNYRGAELDMHFSISKDLHPLQELFDTLRDHGMTGLVSRLERGTL
jgi:hypothetical protein